MQHLYVIPEGTNPSLERFSLCQDQVRFFALHRIKPHAPPLVRAPVNSFEFLVFRTVPPRRSTYRVSCATKVSNPPTASRHRLRHGLPGYLILFAPMLSYLSVSIRPDGCLRHRYSSRSLRISPLHLEFYHPLPYSSFPVSDAVPKLSSGISHPT